MNLPVNRIEELCRAFAALQDDQLESAGLAELERLIREDREVRRLYVQYAGVCAGLKWNLGGRNEGHPVAGDPLMHGVNSDATAAAILLDESGNETVSREVFDAAAHSAAKKLPRALPLDAPGGDAARNDAAAETPKSPVLGFLGGVVEYVSQSRTLLFWFVAMGLVSWFAFQAGSLLIARLVLRNDFDGQVAQGNGSERQRSTPAGSALGQGGKIVARLSSVVDGQWKIASSDGSHRIGAPPVTLPTGTEFAAGQALHLTAGLAELTFDSGAKVILHAPAEFSVVSSLGGELNLGRLTAKVPHAAAGFTVRTPCGKVVDLGTEFGVTVSSDRAMEVVVFVGQVAVSGSSSVSREGGSADESLAAVHVSAGHAVQVAAGRPGRIVPSDDSGFVRNLDHLRQADNDSAYVEMLKKLKPVVWFRMEGKESERVIHDEMGTAPAGELHWDGPGNPFVRGAVGKSLWLRGPKLKDYALLTNYPKSESGRLSVSAWVYADSSPGWCMIAANWGEKNFGQFHFGLRSSPQAMNEDLRIEIADRAGKSVELREGDAHPFPINEWQHVAFTTDGATLRLYRQGREVGVLKHAGLVFPTVARALAIGAKPNDAGTSAAPDSFWSGKLDEIAIFNETLTPENVRRLSLAQPR